MVFFPVCEKYNGVLCRIFTRICFYIADRRLCDVDKYGVNNVQGTQNTEEKRR